MHSITIRKICRTGELRWGIILSNEENRPVFQSTVPLSKAAALATAKILKHRGSDSSAWSKEDGELRFSLVAETRFQIPGKKEGATGIPEAVKNFLAKAKIRWDPPDADPACNEKQADRTSTRGLPGS